MASIESNIKGLDDLIHMLQYGHRPDPGHEWLHAFDRYKRDSKIEKPFGMQ